MAGIAIAISWPQDKTLAVAEKGWEYVAPIYDTHSYVDI